MSQYLVFHDRAVTARLKEEGGEQNVHKGRRVPSFGRAASAGSSQYCNNRIFYVESGYINTHNLKNKQNSQVVMMGFTLKSMAISLLIF